MHWQTLIIAAGVSLAAPALAAPPAAQPSKADAPESFQNKKPRRKLKLAPEVKDHLKRYEAFRAAQKKPLAVVDETRMPRFVIDSRRAAAFDPQAEKSYFQGKIEAYADGALRVSQPMPPRALQVWMQKTGKPASQAPQHTWIRIYDFKTVPKARIEQALGKVMRLEIRKDKGNTPFVFDILPPQ